MQGETGAGRLAERKGRAGVVDVMVRQDDPVKPLGIVPLRLQKAKDGAKAPRISRVDDGRPFAAFIEVAVSAADARDPLDHIRLALLWSFGSVDARLGHLDRRRRRELDVRLGRLGSQLGSLGIAHAGLPWIRNDGVGGAGDVRIARNVFHG